MSSAQTQDPRVCPRLGVCCTRLNGFAVLGNSVTDDDDLSNSVELDRSSK